MLRLHERSAKGTFIHVAVKLDAPRPPALLSNTFYRFRLPIGSHGGVHPLSEEQLPCSLLDERNETIC
jgi:hypothetical protein